MLLRHLVGLDEPRAAAASPWTALAPDAVMLSFMTVVAFRPDEPGVDPSRAAQRLREAGADLVVATLGEASAQLSRLLHPKTAAA